MINKCIKDFEIPVFNENGIMTENVLNIKNGMFFKESKDNILSGADIRLESVLDNTFIEISKETLNLHFKDVEFTDLLELQKQLDKEVAKPRPNGFTPRTRYGIDTLLSMIAEVIEFNEETVLTHKTWKEKDFDYEKMLIENVDVLFFILQLINNSELEEYELDIICKILEEKTKKHYAPYINSLMFINTISRTSFLKFGDYINILTDYINLFKNFHFTKEQIIEQYIKKWKKNIGIRIKEDWTK